jgi:uncharacterized protein (DUF2249 family)
MSLTASLDLRALPGGERVAAVFSAFDQLAPGQRLVLVVDHDPGHILPRFHQERGGLFEWSPLENGPDTWRLEIARRVVSGPREVSEALSWDHDRLDDLEKKAFEERAAGRLADAATTYRVFALGLRRHIGFEEALLFPEFEARAGVPADAGPTAVMRAEHRKIEALLTEIEAGIADPASPVEEARATLHRVLGDHNFKEEQVLYPGTDRMLSEAERDDLVRRIQGYMR